MSSYVCKQACLADQDTDSPTEWAANGHQRRNALQNPPARIKTIWKLKVEFFKKKV